MGDLDCVTLQCISDPSAMSNLPANIANRMEEVQFTGQKDRAPAQFTGSLCL